MIMTRIYVCTHKPFTAPPDKIYVPLLCGAALHPELRSYGYMPDDTGDNISSKNPYYSELTGLYHIYKNDLSSDILGLAHYRRYLLNDNGKLFTEEKIRDALRDHDIITTKQIVLDYPYEEAFGGKHNPADFRILRDVMQKLHPECMDEFERAAEGTHTYFANMMIAGRDVFCEYADWLFEILFAMEEYVDMTGYNDYQKRLYGFVSELLLMVWIRKKGLKVKECSVAVMGEKKETKELLSKLRSLIDQGDTDGAAACFMEAYKKRPDILMEASDVNGELKKLAFKIADMLKAGE